jgi:hypothetical protein
MDFPASETGFSECATTANEVRRLGIGLAAALPRLFALGLSYLPVFFGVSRNPTHPRLEFSLFSREMPENSTKYLISYLKYV